MSSTSDKKPDFLFANCEHCEGIIRIPINVRPDSSVSCPHCNSRFELANVLNQQVPEIQFVDGPAPSPVEITTDEVKIDTESGTEQTDGKFVVPPQLAAGIKKRRRRRRKSSSEGSSSSRKAGPLSEAESNRLARRKDRAVEEREKLQQQREAAALRSRIKQDGSTTSSSRSRSRGASRRKTSKRSPVFEAFKIGAGGLLAIPIAYLLLMWIFSRDPLQLAPKLNAVLPILVPSKMKPDDSTDLPAATEDSNRSRSSSLPVPKTDPDDIDPDNIDFNR